MTYNIHPFLVHFPIAFLFVYSVLKILPFERWFPNTTWKHIERVVLFVGVLGAFAALATGDMAEHLTHPNHALVEMHSTFAALATWLYGIILFGEILTLTNPWLFTKISYKPKVQFLTFLEKLLANVYFSKIMAFFALIAIAVTGLLGGVMIYGVSADPIAGIVLKLLGITI